MRSPEWVTHEVSNGSDSGPSLIKAITTLLEEHHLTYSEITHIGAMTGPASYTQLRIFIATANTLAWVNKIPLFGFKPDTELPDAIPSLLTHAKTNLPLQPIYPHQL